MILGYYLFFYNVFASIYVRFYSSGRNCLTRAK